MMDRAQFQVGATSCRDIASTLPRVLSGRAFPPASAPSHRPGSSRAFTLIELLLALALLSLLVTALFSFVFSMGEIWGRGGDKRLFEQHVSAVTRHVESLFRRAAWPRVGTGSGDSFAVREVRTTDGSKSDLISFDLLDGDRLLEWPEDPLPEVRCQLAQEGDRGLVLYWQSSLEEDFGRTPPRAVVISPFVEKLAYAYYDATGKAWRIEQNLRRNRSNEWVLPDRLVLSFKHGSIETTRELTLPAGGDLPAF